MKLLKSNIVLFCLVAILATTSCTKNFDKLNKNPFKISEITPEKLPYLFSKALSVSSSLSYQTYQNLYPDLYAQYFTTTTQSFQTDRYSMRFDWINSNWTNHYVNCVPQLTTIFENTDSTSSEHALANIWWVFAFHHHVDYYGPTPYFRAGVLDNAPVEYDDLPAIYDDFFKRLTASVDILKKDSSSKVWAPFDLLYAGDLNKWITFANTLRLRLAMRISKVNPEKAKVEAEAAVALGVMEDNEQNAMMTKSLAGNDYNQLAHISVWNEFAMSATAYSYLMGYEDPRLSRYYQPSVIHGNYAGLRNGQTAADLNDSLNLSKHNSQIGTSWVTWNGDAWQEKPSRLQDIMHASESYFLRAEGALNGWDMGGEAQQFYEKGIRTSMEQMGDPVINSAIPTESIDQYIQSEKVPIAPTGFVKSDPVSNVPIKWSADPAMQRKQIGTQKWIALYPDGFEAWAEVRRTGFPDLYPVVKSDNVDLPAGTTIKRIPYPTNEAQNNADVLQRGIELLNGPDNAATPLWWDVD